MAVPKRKMSRSNTRHRRAQWKSKPMPLAPCPQCREPKLAYAVCQVCGTYNGRQLIDMS